MFIKDDQYEAICNQPREEKLFPSFMKQESTTAVDQPKYSRFGELDSPFHEEHRYLSKERCWIDSSTVLRKSNITCLGLELRIMADPETIILAPVKQSKRLMMKINTIVNLNKMIEFDFTATVSYRYEL